MFIRMNGMLTRIYTKTLITNELTIERSNMSKARLVLPWLKTLTPTLKEAFKEPITG